MQGTPKEISLDPKYLLDYSSSINILQAPSVRSPERKIQSPEAIRTSPEPVSCQLQDCCAETKCRLLLYLLFFGFELFDFIVEWLLYYGVSIFRPGLVFGPVDKVQTLALLVFSICGTVFFFIECGNATWEFCFKQSIFNADCMAALTLWVVNIPQLVICIVIGGCREEGISLFLTLKALALSLTVLTQLSCSVIRYLQIAKDQRQGSTAQKAYRILLATGAALNIIGVVVVYVFTLTPLQPSGSTAEPNQTTGGYQVPKHYFNNVSIFFQHSSFNEIITPSGTTIGDLWINIAPVEALLAKPEKPIFFTYQYQQRRHPWRNIVLWDYLEGQWKSTECYRINTRNGSVFAMDQCSSLIQGPVSSLTFRFDFRKPELHLNTFKLQVFGNIYFNIRLNNTYNMCYDHKDITNNPTGGTERDLPIVYHYQLRNGGRQHLKSEDGQITFYTTASDMVDIETIWRTGWMQCECTGLPFPQLDTGLATPCNHV